MKPQDKSPTPAIIIHPPARPPRPEDRAALVRALALVLVRAAMVPSEPPAAEPQHERAA